MSADAFGHTPPWLPIKVVAAMMRRVNRTISTEQKDTIADMLAKSKRPGRRVQFRNRFVQRGTQSAPEPGPLAKIVRSHDELALDAFMLHRALASKEPWQSRELHSLVWARSLGVHTDSDGGAAAVSRVWRRLDQTHHLIARGKKGRTGVYTSLCEDGGGDPYTSPSGTGVDGRYFQVPFEYWEQGWHHSLSLPGKAMLLVGSTLKPPFLLPVDKVPGWYGLSTETAQRGLAELRDLGVLIESIELKYTPLTATMTTREYRYTLAAPFGRIQRARHLTVVPDAAGA